MWRGYDWSASKPLRSPQATNGTTRLAGPSLGGNIRGKANRQGGEEKCGARVWCRDILYTEKHQVAALDTHAGGHAPDYGRTFLNRSKHRALWSEIGRTTACPSSAHLMESPRLSPFVRSRVRVIQKRREHGRLEPFWWGIAAAHDERLDGAAAAAARLGDRHTLEQEAQLAARRARSTERDES